MYADWQAQRYWSPAVHLPIPSSEQLPVAEKSGDYSSCHDEEQHHLDHVPCRRHEGSLREMSTARRLIFGPDIGASKSSER